MIIGFIWRFFMSTEIGGKHKGDDYSNEAMVPNLFLIGNTTYLVIPADKQSLNVMGISSLEVSTAKVEQLSLGAGTPHLAQPSFYISNLNTLTNIGLSTGGLEGVSKEEGLILIDIAEFTNSIDEAKHNIIMSMLNKWAESIKEEEKKVYQDVQRSYKQYLDIQKETIESAYVTKMSPPEFRVYTQSSNNFEGWVQTLSPVEKSHVYKYDTLSGIEKGVNGYREYLQENGPSAAAPFIMATMAIGSSLLGTYVAQLSGVVKAGAHAAVNPIVTAVIQTSKPLLDMGTAALGFLGTVFASGVVYQTSDQIALNVGRLAPKEMNFRFAQKYAKNLMGLIESPDFKRFLTASVIGLVRDGKQMSAADTQQLVRGMEVILLFTALAIVYKSETGKITDQEAGEMVSGKLNVSDDPIKTGLKDMILARVSDHKLGKLEQPLLNGILEYLNGDPNFDELFDVHKVFDGIRQTDALTEAIHYQQRP